MLLFFLHPKLQDSGDSQRKAKLLVFANLALLISMSFITWVKLGKDQYQMSFPLLALGLLIPVFPLLIIKWKGNINTALNVLLWFLSLWILFRVYQTGAMLPAILMATFLPSIISLCIQPWQTGLNWFVFMLCCTLFISYAAHNQWYFFEPASQITKEVSLTVAVPIVLSAFFLISLFNNYLKHKAIEQVLQSQNEALTANQAKGSFLAKMSHEIRTPMTGILGLSEQLLEDQNLSSKSQSLIHTIHHSTDDLLRILNDILDLSKLEERKMELTLSDFNLYTLCEDCIKVFSTRAKKLEIELQLQLHPQTPHFVYGDSSRLRQILFNLLSNAIKFTEKGVVTLSVNPQEDNLYFEIKDNGIGISPQGQQSLFDEYTQVHANSKENYGGTGLGLNISQQLLALMQSKLELESEIGEGSTFYFTVSLPQSQKDSSTPTVAHNESFPIHVLVAEDNPINRQVIAHQLKKLNCHITMTCDGQELLDTFLQNPSHWDCILSDVNMPIMTGLEATQKIRLWEQQNNKQPLPIAALTASAMVEDKEQSAAAGMTHFISKPLKKAELLQFFRDIYPFKASS